MIIIIIIIRLSFFPSEKRSIYVMCLLLDSALACLSLHIVYHKENAKSALGFPLFLFERFLGAIFFILIFFGVCVGK